MRPSTPQWIGIALLVLVLPALTSTAWPLVAALADRALEGLPVSRLALAVALGAALVVALLLIRDYLPRVDLDRARLGWLIAGSWAIALGAVAVMALLVWFVLGLPGLQPPTSLAPRDMDAIATRAFAVVAGLGGVALLVISYRRQRATEHAEHRAERAAEREVSKLFTDTFTTASEQLGSEHPAVRLAGVHALARLADEAPEGREDLVQMVIDVLCAYLRMPYAPAPDPLPKNASKARQAEQREQELEFAALREVRHTIIRIIGARLREETRWRGKDYDFTGVVFDGGDFRSASFTGGNVSFFSATFSSGIASFVGAEFLGGEVSFVGAKFYGQAVSFSSARFAGSAVFFAHCHFNDGAVLFYEADFSDGRVDFYGTHFDGAGVRFCGARFGHGVVRFSAANFRKGTVFFDDNESYGAALGELPIGLKEAIQGGEKGMVVLPPKWKFKDEEINQGAVS